MARDGAAHVDGRVARLAQPPGQVRVLVVHEQVGADPPDRLPRPAGDGAGPPAHAEDVGGGVQAARGGQPVPVVAVAGGVDEVPGGVDQDGPLPRLVVAQARPPGAVAGHQVGAVLPRRERPPRAAEQDEGGGGPHLGPPAGGAQGGEQRVQVPVVHDGVVVEQGDGVLVGPPGPRCDARAETGVDGALDEAHARPGGGAAQGVQSPADDGDGVVARPVVHEDQVVAAAQLGRDGPGGAQGEGGVAPVHDDDADGGARAHRTRSW